MVELEIENHMLFAQKISIIEDIFINNRLIKLKSTDWRVALLRKFFKGKNCARTSTLSILAAVSTANMEEAGNVQINVR